MDFGKCVCNEDEEVGRKRALLPKVFRALNVINRLAIDNNRSLLIIIDEILDRTKASQSIFL